MSSFKSTVSIDKLLEFCLDLTESFNCLNDLFSSGRNDASESFEQWNHVAQQVDLGNRRINRALREICSIEQVFET